MNIVTPIPTAVLFPTGNVSTEAARRDNVQREIIPKAGGNESSAAESGVGSESDRVKTPGQQPQLTYERPQNQQNAQNNPNQGDLFDQDNGKDASAGKENAEDEQQRQQQELAQQQEVDELKSRDREVRTHEQAHAAVGGQYAGAPSYEYENGPDGQQYAVSGEVSIDISQENTPEETIRKMQRVRAAALAPAEPSSQDFQVASEATKLAAEAQSDLTREKSESAKQAIADNSTPQFAEQNFGTRGIDGEAKDKNDQITPPAENLFNKVPDLDEIVDGFAAEPPKRSLDQTETLNIDAAQLQEQFAQPQFRQDNNILRRASVIENFYQNVSVPRTQGIQQSA